MLMCQLGSHLFALGCDVSRRFDDALSAVMVFVQLVAEGFKHWHEGGSRSWLGRSHGGLLFSGSGTFESSHDDGDLFVYHADCSFKVSVGLS